MARLGAHGVSLRQFPHGANFPSRPSPSSHPSSSPLTYVLILVIVLFRKTRAAMHEKCKNRRLTVGGKGLLDVMAAYLASSHADSS